MALTVKRIAKLTEAGRYSDGGNLFVQVTPTGGRSWLIRWERKEPNGKRKQWAMGLGSLKDFGLGEARDRARKVRQQ
jgi:hypothetical protein